MNVTETNLQLEKNLPVVNVSWNKVQHFIEKLNDNSNLTYRLPSGLEWEFACLGRTSVSESQRLTTKLNTNSQVNDSKHLNKVRTNGLLPVNKLPPNQAGLFDMKGNTWEWTSDSYLRSKKNGFIKRLFDRITTERLNRVISGDSYSNLNSRPNCSSEKYAPTSIGSSDIGFRLVLSD